MMAVVLLASATGSPGATTTALGLALHWPRDVLLVDADPVPAQAVEVGHLGGVSTQGRGLMALAQAHREGRDLAAAAWELGVDLACQADHQRKFLAGFTHPGAANLYGTLWTPVAEGLRRLGESGVDVIVDVGRVGAGLAPALVENADAVLMVTRSSLRALAALRLHLPSLMDAVDLASPQALRALVLIGPCQPYDAREIAGHFGVPVVATLPDEPRQAAIHSDAAAPPRRFEQGSLARALAAAAQQLSASLASSADRMVPQEVSR